MVLAASLTTTGEAFAGRRAQRVVAILSGRSSEAGLLVSCPTIDRCAMEVPRRWICFDEPDEAYLAAAALRRYRDGSIDAILIPSDRGPAIDIASDALGIPSCGG